MKKNIKKQITLLLKNTEKNFSNLIDIIIMCDENDDEENAMHIIGEIELFCQKNEINEIKLLQNDFKNRNNTDKEMLFYHCMYTRIFNDNELREKAINYLIENYDENFINYIESICNYGYRKAGDNVKRVIEAVKENKY